MPLCHEHDVHGKSTISQTVPTVENLQQISFQVKVEPSLTTEGVLLSQIQQVLQNLCAASFAI